MEFKEDEYIATYVCRMCGKKIQGAITGNKDILNFNMSSYCVTGDFHDSGVITKYARHYCDDGNYGIGDFIGFTRGDNYNKFNDSTVHNKETNKHDAVYKDTESIDIEFCDYLVSVIRDCYFEPGKWTNADSVFYNRFNSKREVNLIDEPFKELEYIVQNNINDTYILEGVLHILSAYDYEEIKFYVVNILSYHAYEKIKSYIISIIELCSTNTSVIVQDCVLQCMEKWNPSDFIQILNDMDITENWLKEYRDDILKDIQNNTEV